MSDSLVIGIVNSIVLVIVALIGKGYGKRAKKVIEEKIDSVHSEVKVVQYEQQRGAKRDLTILVLDDSEYDLEQIEKVVKKTGKKYELYTDEELFIKQIPDGVNIHIIDHFLNKMSGIDVLREIKEKNEGNFVIVYTGAQSEQVIIDYTNAGVNRFIYKENPDQLKQLAKFLNEGIRILSSK